MNDFKQQLVNVARGKGFNPIVGDIHRKQEQWLNWFRGDVNGFHTFSQKVNGKVKNFGRLTMNMPKKVCEDWTSILWNESCMISVKDEEGQRIIDNVLEENAFEIEFGALLEQTFGMGMGYMIEYLDKGKTAIDFVTHDNAMPIEWNNSKVKALMSKNRFKIEENSKSYYITHMMYHYVRDNRYFVEHEVYKSESSDQLGKSLPTYIRYVFDESTAEALKKVERKDGKISNIKYLVEYQTSKPFFQVLRPNIKNHYDTKSPYGVSIYSTALDYFRLADTLFDLIENEARTTKTRIVLSHKALTTQENITAEGEMVYIQLIDENETEYVGIPSEDEELVKFFQGEIRTDKLERALNHVLQLISLRILGKNQYALDEFGNYVNEKAVISSNSDKFKAKKKHEIILEKAIRDMCYSILELERSQKRYSKNPQTVEIEIKFDDSLVNDDEQQKLDTLELFKAGLMPKYRVLMKYLNIDETEAKALIEEAKKDDEEANDNFLGRFAIDESTED